MKRVGRIFGLVMVLFIALSTLTALAASYQNGDRVTVTTDQVWAFHGGRQPGETSSTSTAGTGKTTTTTAFIGTRDIPSTFYR